MKSFGHLLLSLILLSAAPSVVRAQSVLYPHHFDLHEVTLLQSPMQRAMDKNIQTLLQYDVDRLLTPFVRQAGLSTGAYAHWLSEHPNFENWGGDNFDLSGHIGGHYLSALSLAYAASHSELQRQELKQRIEHMLSVMRDCQDAWKDDQHGLRGFIGGQPFNEVWRAMYRGDIEPFSHVKWQVPLYVQHKIMAGLRDAYIYAHEPLAGELLKNFAEWAIDLVSVISDNDMQTVLETEHGGMNETLADCYAIFGDKRYLDAARRYSQLEMVDGMERLNLTFLDNKHANTQVPKYIGFERIGESDFVESACRAAAENFWTDVVEHRTTCIGGNSVDEHFLAEGNANRYIDHADGPESCNTNNMLKLSEMLADRTGDARFADFYEQAMWNHILSTQDPETGGYVYFTSLRPQAYRIYSTVNESMWCCVGTGMENHSKYGHFIYTHDDDSVLYVNLFTASRLENKKFAVTQRTSYPYEQQTTITIERAGKFTLAIRHPWWTTSAYLITVNGQPVNLSLRPGQSTFARITRKWKKGDVVRVQIPMELRTSLCPNYYDYVAFHYGPILLAAQTTATTEADKALGLKEETLQNEYGHDGRMDHSPGVMGKMLSLTTAPMLIGERTELMGRVTEKDNARLQWNIDVSGMPIEGYRWKTLTLRPFYEIHHARYMTYWYANTYMAFFQSDMVRTEVEAKMLNERTIDFVGTGEQQSEAGHESRYSDESRAGSYQNETYRDAQAGGFVEYKLYNKTQTDEGLAVLCRFTTADRGRKATLLVDGMPIAEITIPSEVKGAQNGFYNAEYAIPDNLLKDADGKTKQSFTVRLAATAETPIPGWYYLRLVKEE